MVTPVKRAGTSLCTCHSHTKFTKGRSIFSRSTENGPAFPQSSRTQPRPKEKCWPSSPVDHRPGQCGMRLTDGSRLEAQTTRDPARLQRTGADQMSESSHSTQSSSPRACKTHRAKPTSNHAWAVHTNTVHTAQPFLEIVFGLPHFQSIPGQSTEGGRMVREQRHACRKNDSTSSNVSTAHQHGDTGGQHQGSGRGQRLDCRGNRPLREVSRRLYLREQPVADGRQPDAPGQNR